MKRKIEIPFVRNPYNYDADALSTETGLKCEDESLARQEFVEEADINYVAETFMKTGQLKQVINMPTSGDFSGTFDFQSSMNLIVKAQREFMELPAKIRSRFDNDPAKLISFLEDEDNREEATALGLIERKRPQAATETDASRRAAGAPPTDAGTAGPGPDATKPSGAGHPDGGTAAKGVSRK